MASDFAVLCRYLWGWLQKKAWLASSAGWCTRVAVLMAVAILPVLAVSILLPALAGPVRLLSSWLQWETTGLIIVDSPKVYTRERLVNDRLEEASWLDSQLKDTADQLFKPQFRSVAGQLTILKREELSIASGVGAGRTAKATAKNADEPLSTADQSKIGTQPSQTAEPTIDRFRDLHTFREEIRAEMMQTQLDDRHDLGGNTVYRLTFDTTIVAGPNTREIAWIDVDIIREVNNEEKVAIFEDWKKYVETETKRLLRSWLRSFMEDGLSPEDQLSIFSFFVNEICATQPSEGCHEVISQFIDWYAENEQEPKKAYLKRALTNVAINTSIENIYAQYNEFCYRAYRSSKANQNNINFHLPKSWTDDNLHDQTVPCQPPSTALSAISAPYYRLFAIVDLYDRVRATRTKSSRYKLRFDDIKKKCGSRGGEIREKECKPLTPWHNSETIRWTPRKTHGPERLGVIPSRSGREGGDGGSGRIVRYG